VHVCGWRDLFAAIAKAAGFGVFLFLKVDAEDGFLEEIAPVQISRRGNARNSSAK
jgi:hypothetical protein